MFNRLQPGSQRIAVAVLSAWGCLCAAGNAGAGETPLRIVGKVPLVQAEINGQGPFNFILDTGASETVITPRTAERLGIVQHPTTGNQKTAHVGSIAVGDAGVEHLRVFVFDPPQAVPLRLNNGMDYHGILGFSFLSRFIMTLDYAGKRVTFTPLARHPGRLSALSREAGIEVELVRFTLREGLVLTTGRVNGGRPLDFLIDTGASEIVLFPETARSLGVLAAASPVHPGVGFAELDSIQLGRASLPRLPAVVHMPPQMLRSEARYAGILGYPFLSAFVVTFNYRDRELMLQRSPVQDRESAVSPGLLRTPAHASARRAARRRAS